jgi:hypothetical protein
VGILTFAIGQGGSDVIPHQLVRTRDDRLYIFAYGGDLSNSLKGYWTLQPGFPGGTGDFGGSISVTYPAVIISVETVYDGQNTIHILTNATDGYLRDQPFDITTNTLRPAKILDSGLITANTNVGTSGVSAGMDAAGRINIAYWAAGNHIQFRSYAYDPAADVLTLVNGPVQLDLAGNANHPALAVSPLDDSISVAWVSEAATPAVIQVRTRRAGVWGGVEVVSTSPVWTSRNFGINIDQGPSLFVDSDGTRRLVYIEDWRLTEPTAYGRVHQVVNQGSGWVDQYLGFYTNDPAVTVNSAGQVYIIGHGYPLNQAPCTSIDDMCVYQLQPDQTWSSQIIAVHQGSGSFDTSPSVKWTGPAYTRPDVVEWIFPEVFNGDYTHTVLHYGRIGIQ